MSEEKKKRNVRQRPLRLFVVDTFTRPDNGEAIDAEARKALLTKLETLEGDERTELEKGLSDLVPAAGHFVEVPSDGPITEGVDMKKRIRDLLETNGEVYDGMVLEIVRMTETLNPRVTVEKKRTIKL